MRYVAVEDVRVVLPRDVHRPGENDPIQFDDTEIEPAIDYAQAEVEAKTSRVYTDLDQVPALLKGIIADIAAYLLAVRYNICDLERTKPVVLRYQRAEDLLQGIINGTVDLPGPDGDLGASKPLVKNMYEGRLWTLEDFGLGYRRRVDRGRY